MVGHAKTRFSLPCGAGALAALVPAACALSPGAAPPAIAPASSDGPPPPAALPALGAPPSGCCACRCRPISRWPAPHATGGVFDIDGFDWGHLAALARLALATSRVPLEGKDAIVQSVLDAADALVSLGQVQAWGQPYAPASGEWVWGSNGQLLNNLVVLVTAYDLSGRERYRCLALEGVDYLFGRNALNRSFITGYGDFYSQNQHSRMYSASIDYRSPHPPPGTLAGGPNTRLQDPLAHDQLQGCIGQFCYIDDIYTASTNELAINWNSAPAWVASFLADQGARRNANRCGASDPA